MFKRIPTGQHISNESRQSEHTNWCRSQQHHQQELDKESQGADNTEEVFAPTIECSERSQVKDSKSEV